MLRNYFKIAFRSLWRDKTFSLVNLIGLSCGIACALLIHLWAHDELNFDKFHGKDSRLFQVMSNQSYAGGIVTSGETNPNLGEHLTKNLPEIEYATVSTPPVWFPKVNLSVGNRIVKAAGNFVGKDYLNIFSYQLTQGDKSRVLADKHSIVLSEAMAVKLFNSTENAIGKTVKWHIYNFEKQSVVSGILKATPANSSVQFDFLLSFDMFRDLMSIDNNISGGGPFFTYIVAKQGTDVNQLNRKINRLVEEKNSESQQEFFLGQYSADYLYDYENGVQVGGRSEYIKLFTIIAIFVLLIACINFMNLSTAKAARRMKEVGIRKVVGASRKTLVLQYLGEATLMAFASVFVSIPIVSLLLPPFNEITGKQLTLHLDANLFGVLMGIALLTGLLSGSYPALYLSGFNPATVLKGKISDSATELWMRKGLVVFQFVLSVVFIVSVLVVYKQVKYMQTKNLGYEKEHVIHFESEGKVSKSMEAFLAEAKKIPGVVNASCMVGNIVGSYGAGREVDWQGKKIPMHGHQIGYGLIETLGMKLKAGRSFSRKSRAEFSKVILNETAVRILELTEPIGKMFADREIIGVIKDFHFQSLHEEVEPMFFQLDTMVNTVMVKTEAGQQRETLDRLAEFYKTYNPGFSFDYAFLNQIYQAQYVAENRVAVLSKYFAGLTLLISCLGLFGLAAFTVERRRKEIGIRKILGASVSQVVALLSRDFLVLVLVAFVIATPIAWYAMNEWLQDFAYRIEISWWVFALAGVLALLIALLTVSFQAVKAALANPVKSLRSE